MTHEADNQQVVGLERGTIGPKAEKVDRVKTLRGRRCLKPSQALECGGGLHRVEHPLPHGQSI